MYVASGDSNVITIYDLDSPIGPRKIGEITDGLIDANGMALDGRGTLYVANWNEGNAGGDVTIYPAGATSPSLTLTQGLNVPIDVAVDANDDVYVANRGAAPSIVVYPQGQASPAQTITSSLIQQPAQLQFDSGQDLYFSDNNTGISELASGSQTPESLNLQGLRKPSGLALDPVNGNIFISDLDLNEVLVYAPGNVKRIRALQPAMGACLLADGRLRNVEYLFVPQCSFNGIVWVVKHNAKRALATWDFGAGRGAASIAFKPAGIP
jgi:hypothetical protein